MKPQHEWYIQFVVDKPRKRWWRYALENLVIAFGIGWFFLALACFVDIGFKPQGVILLLQSVAFISLGFCIRLAANDL